MKYIAIIVALVISVGIVKVDGSYTYQMSVKRTENLIGQGAPVAFMDSKVTPIQKLTYSVSVGPDNPLLIEAYLANNGTVYFDNGVSDLLNACDSYASDSWQYVITQVVNEGLLPSGDCSAEKGSYMINQIVTISVTFTDMIKCGDYDLVITAYVSPPRTMVYQLYFTFNISEDSYCT